MVAGVALTLMREALMKERLELASQCGLTVQEAPPCPKAFLDAKRKSSGVAVM